MPKLDEILAKFMDEVPQFIAVDCVNLETGSSLPGGASIDRNVDLGLASSSYVEVVEANGRALDFLGIGADSLEEMLITARDANIVLYPIGRRYCIALAITRRGSLNVARSILKKYEADILAALALEGGEA